MNAREIVAALGGRWYGDYGMAPCAAHQDRNPSLSISEQSGRVLVHCHAGCDQLSVIAALKARGHWKISNANTGVPVISPFGARRTRPSSHALKLWSQAQRAAGSLVETYLENRGLIIDLQEYEAIRFLARFGFAPGLNFPAMVVAVTSPAGEITAVQLTALDRSGIGKARIACPRKTIGPLCDGAVHLGQDDTRIIRGLAEGVETALAAMMLTGVPCWAVLGAQRLSIVSVPNGIQELHLFADDDHTGRIMAERAARAHARTGRRVRLRYPPPLFNDFAEVAEARALGALA